MSETSGKFASERVARHVQSRLNPIRGLTPAVLTQRLEAWRTGHLGPLAKLWEEMEARDMLLAGVISKRKRDAARCRWEILVEDDTPEASLQKEFLEEFYSRLQATSVLDQNQVGGVPLLLRQMMDAVGKRYSIHEIVWKPGLDGSLTVTCHHAPVWFFEGRTGRLRFLQGDADINGVEMPDGEWLVSVGDGLMVATSIAYLAKDLGLKDWLNYTERFGMPTVDASTNAVPDSDEWNALVDAVENFVADGYLVRNESARVSLIEAKGGGALPHPPLIDYIDRSLAALWRGADLGTKSAGDGSGQGASLQKDETESLRADDCEWLSETLHLGLEIHALRWKFGADVVPLAYIQISPPNAIDTAAEVAVDEFLLRSGAPVGLADTLARYNRPKPKDGEDLLTAPAPNPGPTPPGMDPMAIANAQAEQVQAVREAFASDLQPVFERLRRILDIEDPEVFKARLAAFRDELPTLLQSVSADPAAAAALEQIMAKSLLSGMVAGANPGRGS